jgi:FMN phosphatase YigB (HAD superfamily)
MKTVLIFDLDETVIDSRHRTPNNPDGTLNLAGYIANHTRENVMRDTLLPLARVMREAYSVGHYVIVCTARDMKQADYDFLALHGLKYHKIMSRDTVRHPSHYRLSDGAYKARWLRGFLNLRQFAKSTVVMFDDAKPVKATLRKLGIRVLCAHKINRKLLTQSAA